MLPDHDEQVLHVDTLEEVCATPGRISRIMPKLKSNYVPGNIIRIPSSTLDGKTQYELDWALKEVYCYGRDPFTNNIGGRWPPPEDDETSDDD